MRKYIVVVLLVLGLFLVGGRIFRPQPKPVEIIKPEPPKTIDKAELSKFLNTWSEYLSSPISKKDAGSLSLGSGEISKKTKEWLAKKDWDAERFFYVEDRVRAIVRSAQIRNLARNNIKIFELQLKQTKDKSITSSINSMIEEQKQNLNIENVTDAEMDMVSTHLVTIRNVLEGKTKL